MIRSGDLTGRGEPSAAGPAPRFNRQAEARRGQPGGAGARVRIQAEGPSRFSFRWGQRSRAGVHEPQAFDLRSASSLRKWKAALLAGRPR